MPVPGGRALTPGWGVGWAGLAALWKLPAGRVPEAWTSLFLLLGTQLLMEAITLSRKIIQPNGQKRIQASKRLLFDRPSKVSWRAVRSTRIPPELLEAN